MNPAAVCRSIYTHQDIFTAPGLLAAVIAFVDAPSLEPPPPFGP